MLIIPFSDYERAAHEVGYADGFRYGIQQIPYKIDNQFSFTHQMRNTPPFSNEKVTHLYSVYADGFADGLESCSGSSLRYNSFALSV